MDWFEGWSILWKMTNWHGQCTRTTWRQREILYVFDLTSWAGEGGIWGVVDLQSFFDLGLCFCSNMGWHNAWGDPGYCALGYVRLVGGSARCASWPWVVGNSGHVVGNEGHGACRGGGFWFLFWFKRGWGYRILINRENKNKIIPNFNMTGATKQNLLEIWRWRR